MPRPSSPAAAEAVAAEAVLPLRLFRPDNNLVALGLTVNYLMAKPAFANLHFGEWSRILIGQINRQHYCFVMDARDRIHGFVGWALATSEKAEAWIADRGELRFEDSRSGDCVIVNAWAADSAAVNRFMIDQMRRMARDKTAAYFKRYYADGRKRAVRLPLSGIGA